MYSRANRLKQSDLLPVFGSKSRVSEVVNGKRNISKVQAKKLADFFPVSAGLFICFIRMARLLISLKLGIAACYNRFY